MYIMMCQKCVLHIFRMPFHIVCINFRDINLPGYGQYVRANLQHEHFNDISQIGDCKLKLIVYCELFQM